MRTFVLAGSALALAVPALAQVAPASTAEAPRTQMAAKERTRADVQAKVSEHFARVDADRDGFVTKAEADAAAQAFRSQWAERVKDRRDQRGDAMFERLDSNRDGAVSRAEWDAGQAQREQRLAARSGASGGHSGAHGMRMGMGGFGGHMFGMADANKDGKVSLQEAQAAALKHFDMVDANRDGRITRDERIQMRQRVHSDHRG